MSLNHSKYLRTLDSERREVPTFPTVQQQLDRIRSDIHLLFDAVDRILNIQEGHEKEHAAMYSAAVTPATVDVSTDQPNLEPRPRDKDHHNPYL
jgi:hypothetical protein